MLQMLILTRRSTASQSLPSLASPFASRNSSSRFARRSNCFSTTIASVASALLSIVTVILPLFASAIATTSTTSHSYHQPAVAFYHPIGRRRIYYPSVFSDQHNHNPSHKRFVVCNYNYSTTTATAAKPTSPTSTARIMKMSSNDDNNGGNDGTGDNKKVMNMWDTRYSESNGEEYAFGIEPNDYLKETYDSIFAKTASTSDTNDASNTTKKELKVLMLGEGEGRNAVFLASKEGLFDVTAVDISMVGLKKTQKLAQSKGVTVNTIQADLGTYNMGIDQWDIIVSIFCHLPPIIRKKVLYDDIPNALKPNGQALIQAITVNDYRYEQSLKTVDYIKRYIFPGSFIPCVSIISQTAGNNALVINNLLDIGQSYATTLKDWRERFFDNIDEVKKQGFDERFIRLWEFYLCYCEGGFMEKSISDVQIHFRKAH